MKTKEKIRILLSGFLAVVFLFSTLSFTVNQHYCGKMLMESTIFKSVKDCCAVYNSNIDKTYDISNCCSNLQIKINGQKELKDQVPSSIDIEVVGLPEFFQFQPSTQITEKLTKSKITQNCHPPGTNRQLYIFNETFLI